MLFGALTPPGPVIRDTVVGGVTYSSNQEITDFEGRPYVMIPVNTEVASIVLEVDDEADTRVIRGFLDELDTFVPGEHVLELGSTELHVIVDGITE